MKSISRLLGILALAAVSACSYIDMTEPVPEFDLPQVLYDGQTYVFKDLVPRISYQWSLSDETNAWFENDMLVASVPSTKAIVEEEHIARPLTVLAQNRRHPEYTFERKTEIHPWELVFVGMNDMALGGGSCSVDATVKLAMYDVVSRKLINNIDDGKRLPKYRDVKLVLESIDQEDGLELIAADDVFMTFKAVQPGSYTVVASLKNGSRKDKDIVATATLVVE